MLRPHSMSSLDAVQPGFLRACNSGIDIEGTLLLLHRRYHGRRRGNRFGSLVRMGGRFRRQVGKGRLGQHVLAVVEEHEDEEAGSNPEPDAAVSNAESHVE